MIQCYHHVRKVKLSKVDMLFRFRWVISLQIQRARLVDVIGWNLYIHNGTNIGSIRKNIDKTYHLRILNVCYWRLECIKTIVCVYIILFTTKVIFVTYLIRIFFVYPTFDFFLNFLDEQNSQKYLCIGMLLVSKGIFSMEPEIYISISTNILKLKNYFSKINPFGFWYQFSLSKPDYFWLDQNLNLTSHPPSFPNALNFSLQK